MRWREGSRRRGRTFDRKADAQNFLAFQRRREQLGQAAVPDDVQMREFVETYWRLHAVPNLSQATRDLYSRVWALHILPRLGDYGVRELTPKRLTRFRVELEKAQIGTATIVKAMTIVQSILTFAVAEYNVAAAVPKPRYERAREPHIFLPADVEAIRAKLNPRDAILVSLLAYSGPRPEEVVRRLAWRDVGERAIRYVDTKRHRVRYTPLLAPLADDLRAWFLASGRPADDRPVLPAHDAGFWADDDWRNWRKRVWHGEPERKRVDRRNPASARAGCAPAGTRPRDLRSSFVTLRVYEGVPLTQIAREVGTSVRMIEQHYAGVIANWDGKQVPADRQIRAARQALDAEWTR
ncbi:MAG: tyrosine-type recombinase/integrase [Solirubrobacteraceae bacterium]